MALLGEHHLTIPGETLPAKRTQRPPSDAAGDGVFANSILSGRRSSLRPSNPTELPADGGGALRDQRAASPRAAGRADAARVWRGVGLDDGGGKEIRDPEIRVFEPPWTFWADLIPLDFKTSWTTS